MASSLRLKKVTPKNIDAACGLTVRPKQKRFVAPVVRSLADAYVHGETAWPRLIYNGDRLVGFVMANFDPHNPVDAFRCVIWRLTIAATRQGRGYGRFAVEAVCAEARRRGQRRVTVTWVPGKHGPEGFYLRLGFRPTGQRLHGEVVGELPLA
jgi:diamine N-acetyltransferase